MRAQAASMVRKRRQQLGWTQGELARAMGSSPSRVSKLEAGDATVSLDLYERAMCAMAAKMELRLDDSADPFAEPALDPQQARQLSRRLLRRQWAVQIAAQHAVDAGDVEHALRNLELEAGERLVRMFQRAQLFGQSAH